MTFEEIYRKYFHSVMLYVRTYTQDEDLIQEITQETFVKAMQAIDRFDGSKDILAWLFTIARNTYFSHCRKKKFIATAPIPEPSTDTLVQNLLDKEQAFLIHQFLHSMKEPYKEVFTLRVMGELPFETIGRLFGKSAGWARVTYYRAKTMIVNHLEGTENE